MTGSPAGPGLSLGWDTLSLWPPQGFYFTFGMLLADWLLRAFTEVLLLIPDPYFLPDSLPGPASISLLSMVKDKVDPSVR